MGLENFDLGIVAYLTNVIAACLGAFFVLMCWIKIVAIRRAHHVAQIPFSLWTLTAAVAIPPVFLGLFQALPYSMKDRLVYGMRIGEVDLLLCSIASALMVILSVAGACRVSNAPIGTVRVGALVLLLVYVSGFAIFVDFAWLN